MWGWNQYLTDWSEEQKALLCSSWRKSTLNTYKPAWEKWANWAKMKKIDCFNPTGSDLAKFLADLHQQEGLALSTILLHKSVVATFSNPGKQGTLSSHVLVKQVLKSIALAKPKTDKAPIWDPVVLINTLSCKNPNTTSLYETSIYTATLLLLCSRFDIAEDITRILCL